MLLIYFPSFLISIYYLTCQTYLTLHLKSVSILLFIHYSKRVYVSIKSMIILNLYKQTKVLIIGSLLHTQVFWIYKVNRLSLNFRKLYRLYCCRYLVLFSSTYRSFTSYGFGLYSILVW